MNCDRFRQWSEQLMNAQPVLDSLPAAREHVVACRACCQQFERRLRLESWEDERRDYWRRSTWNDRDRVPVTSP